MTAQPAVDLGTHVAARHRIGRAVEYLPFCQSSHILSVKISKALDSENGAGDLNSQAHKAVVGRSKSFRIASMRPNPSNNGNGVMKRTRVMR